MFCRYIVPTHVLVCLCNEMRAKMCSLSGCFKRWLLYGGFFCYYCVLSSVCILKRPFSLHNFRQYTNICARVCLCFFADASCLSLSSHYFCFVFFFCFDYQWEKNTFVLCDTFTLFSSFLDGKSKNSKRKSSAIFCLSLTSNSLEKNRTNQTKNSRLWSVLGKARQTSRGCISQDEMSSKRDGRKQGKLSRKKQNTKGFKNTKRKTTFGWSFLKVESGKKQCNFAH